MEYYANGDSDHLRQENFEKEARTENSGEKQTADHVY